MKTWTKTKVKNFQRHKSGTYYARRFVGGKEQWKSLKTPLLEVAKARLREVAGEVAETVSAREAQSVARMTFGHAAEMFLDRMRSSGLGLQGRGRNRKRISESSIHYRAQTVKALLRSWPELENFDVRKISDADCERWAERFSVIASPTRFNNTLDSLRHILRLAIQAGARHSNPAEAIGRCQVKFKNLVLPERDQFAQLVRAIRTAGAW